MSYEYNDSYDLEELIDTLNNKISKISDLEAKLAESEESHHKNIVELTKIATEKDRKIEELKQQLAESEKKFKASKDAIKFQNEEQKEWMDKYFDTAIKLEKVNKQLAESEKEVAKREKIIVLELKSTIKYIEHCEKLKYHNGLQNIKEHFLEHLEEYDNGNFERIDKHYNHEKIKFAVEKLEKVKDWCENHKFSDEYDYVIAYEPDEEDASGCVDYLKEHIDNQIDELKKEMK